MRRLGATLVLLLAALWPSPALACDPWADFCLDDPWAYSWDEPAWDAWWWDEPDPWWPEDPAPQVYEPPTFLEPEPVWTPPPAPTPVPVAVVPPSDTYRVDQVYAGDVVSSSGASTTITTSSVQQDPGTVARVVEIVGTGQATAFEGQTLNQRLGFADGTQSGGQVIETFYYAGSSWIHSSYVFWHDDSLTSLTAPVPTPAPTPAPTATIAPIVEPVVTPPVVTPPLATPMPVGPAPTSPPAPGIPPSTGVMAPPISSVPVTVQPSSPPVPRTVRAGVALAAQGDVLSRAEVLRGRRVPLWPRGFVDGVSAAVRSWQLVGAEVTAADPTSGSGEIPIVAFWDHPSPPGIYWTMRFLVTIEVPGEGPRSVEAAIEVAVRSPALVE